MRKGENACNQKPFKNIMRKGENAGDKHFLLFPKYLLPYERRLFFTQLGLNHGVNTGFENVSTFCWRSWNNSQNIQLTSVRGRDSLGPVSFSQNIFYLMNDIYFLHCWILNMVSTRDLEMFLRSVNVLEIPVNWIQLTLVRSRDRPGPNVGTVKSRHH